MSEMPAPPEYAFADRKNDGVFPVVDSRGGTVASITVNRWSGRSFSAGLPNGAPLCSGKSRGLFSSYWDCTDPGGAVIVALRRAMLGTSKTVELADGRELRIAGQFLNRDWQLTDRSGRIIIEAMAQGSGWSFHPDGCIVRCWDESISFAQFVGIVELNRLMNKAARSNNS